MAQIDALLQFLIDQRGHQLWIPADDNCQIADATGRHPINRVMTADEVGAIVLEALPGHLHEAWAAGQPVSFVRRSDAGEVAVAAEHTPEGLRVVVARSAGDYLERMGLAAREAGASDLVLSEGAAPLLRREGALQPVGDERPLPPGVLASFVERAAPGATPEAVARRFLVSLGRAGRARCTCLSACDGPSLTLRLLPETVLPAEGLPPALRDILAERRGLLLAAAPPGEGLTTLLASLLAALAAEAVLHIVCLEALPEVPTPEGKALVVRCHVSPEHARAEAINGATSVGADVLFVDEIADAPSLRAALDAARAGCLVVAGCRGRSAAEAVSRLVERVPPAERAEVRERLSTALEGAIAQALCPAADGKRLAVRDILVSTSTAAEAIRHGRWDDLEEGIRAVGFSHDDGLLRLAVEGKVTTPDAEARALDRKRFREALDGRLRRAQRAE